MITNYPKLYFGPMSSEIVDYVINVNAHNTNIGLIPSRRQIDFSSGYVNNWTTKSFSNYVKNLSENTLLQRDHSGPMQGEEVDDGLKSLSEDSLHLDLIHIDPWKKYKNFDDGCQKTLELIKHCIESNADVLFEVGTEEAIRKFEAVEIEKLLMFLNDNLSNDEFNKIIYVVLQSGVGLDLGNSKNTGSFDSSRLQEMNRIIKKFGKLSKEHNGDFLTTDEISTRFDLGLDSINVAPELGQFVTEFYLKCFKENEDLCSKFYNICLESKKWVKWVDKTFDPNKEKDKLIMISGHYILSHPHFLELKSNYLSHHQKDTSEFNILLEDHLSNSMLKFQKFLNG